MKYPFLLVCLFSAFHSDSQVYQVKKRPTLFINSASFDFKTPAGGSFRSLSDNYSGFGISYWQGLSNHFDLSFAGNFTRLFYPFKNGLNYRSRQNLSEVDAALNIKPLTDNHVVVPYLTAGIGFYVFSSTNGSYAPLGAGLQFNIKNKIFIQTNFQYRAAVTDEAASHLFYGLHVGVPLTKRRPLVNGDGTQNMASGKPGNYDRDKDGVPDSVDNCPNRPGLAAYKGCPAPKDADGDGIVDSLDKCPTVAGVSSRGGCPVPDTDNDGLDDDVDKCPNEAGPFSNGGCPVPAIKQPVTPPGNKPAAPDTVAKPLLSYDIFFYSGLTTMSESSKPILANVVDIMKKNPAAKAIITGYADNIEFEDAAVLNSGRRATDIAINLIRMGIPKSRIVTSGAGTANPKASNETVVGRSQNRRVEIRLM